MTWQELLNEGEKRLSKKGVGTGKNLSCRHFAYQRKPALHTEDSR